jgi:hypothetical protein
MNIHTCTAGARPSRATLRPAACDPWSPPLSGVPRGVVGYKGYAGNAFVGVLLFTVSEQFFFLNRLFCLGRV